MLPKRQSAPSLVVLANSSGAHMLARMLRVTAVLVVALSSISGGAAFAVGVGSKARLANVEPLRTRPLIWEEAPAVGEGVVAWAQNRGPGGESFDAWVRVGTSAPRRINARHTEGFPGGFDGTRVVYQQIDEPENNDSDLWIYDVASSSRVKLGRRINTDAWEWGASLAGDWVLFGRGRLQGIFDPGNRVVLLVNRATGERRELAKTDSLDVEVYPGQVSGNYAVWSVCRDRSARTLCDTFRHDIENRDTRKLPSGGAPQQFAASVTSSGAVYAARGGIRCGAATRLVRLDPGVSAKVILRFPRGTEPMRTSAYQRDTGETEIGFDRSDCSARRSDTFRVIDTP